MSAAETAAADAAFDLALEPHEMDLDEALDPTVMHTVAVDGSIVTLHRTEHARAPGVLYGGALYPTALPPVGAELNDRPVAICARESSVYSVAELTTSAWFRRAADFQHVSRAMLPQPLRDYADVYASVRGDCLPEFVIADGGMTMSRDVWMLQGVRHTRPPMLTDTQRKQAEGAAFWAAWPLATDIVRRAAARTLAYYGAGGYEVIVRKVVAPPAQHAAMRVRG